jgi:hypothetical protein
VIRTTRAQFSEIRTSIQKSNIYRNEKIWTFLIASLFDKASDQSKIIQLLCGDPLQAEKHLDVWFEAQPLPPRKGYQGYSEGNTKLDLAFGHILPRGKTAAGIKYGPHEPGSWVCFVEAKCLSDCSTTVSYDPLRNQLARVIENLLCFQDNGKFPERIFFTLLTPRIFKENPNSRLYGYKMQEYEDKEKILEDIERCSIEKRDGGGFVYPDMRQRLAQLRLNWVSYEDLLEPEYGEGLDIVRNPEDVKELKEKITQTCIS